MTRFNRQSAGSGVRSAGLFHSHKISRNTRQKYCLTACRRPSAVGRRGWSTPPGPIRAGRQLLCPSLMVHQHPIWTSQPPAGLLLTVYTRPVRASRMLLTNARRRQLPARVSPGSCKPSAAATPSTGTASPGSGSRMPRLPAAMRDSVTMLASLPIISSPSPPLSSLLYSSLFLCPRLTVSRLPHLSHLLFARLVWRHCLALNQLNPSPMFHRSTLNFGSRMQQIHKYRPRQTAPYRK